MVFVVVAIERMRNSGVKASMVYVRVMLAWLLPTLGLAAAGQYAFEPVSLFPADCACAFLSASGHGKPARLPDARSFERSTRVQLRRIGTHFGSSGTPAYAAGSEPQVFVSGPVILSASCPETTLSLAQTWQFQLRTALEPRAPSSVS